MSKDSRCLALHEAQLMSGYASGLMGAITNDDNEGAEKYMALLFASVDKFDAHLESFQKDLPPVDVTEMGNE